VFSTRLASLSLALALILTACAWRAPATLPAVPPAATAKPTSITLTDALGRTVTLPRAPQRIALAGRAVTLVTDAVYLFPAAPARVVTLGKNTQGKDFVPVIDPNHEGKLKLETQVGPEQVAVAKPDVVLLKSYMADTLGKPLESLSIPVVYVDFETPEQYQRDLATLGQVLGDPARAKQVSAFYQERVDRVSKALAGLSEDKKPRVLLLYYNDKDGQVAFNVPPMAWIQTWMAQTAGGRPVWKDAKLGQGWTKVNLEQIAAWDADQIYIIVYAGNVDDVVKRLKADPQWQALRAVKQNKLYAFPTDYYSWDQSDTRWILGLMWLAGKIQPDRFANLNVQQEVRTFYKEMYNLDDAAFQKYIQPNLAGDLN
jgi:iron complex transport system substrate-binding protein